MVRVVTLGFVAESNGSARVLYEVAPHVEARNTTTGKTVLAPIVFTNEGSILTKVGRLKNNVVCVEGGLMGFSWVLYCACSPSGPYARLLAFIHRAPRLVAVHKAQELTSDSLLLLSSMSTYSNTE